MRIHIFGASGSGVTTLGKQLSQQLRYPYFDNDEFFWEPSDPPFTIRRDPQLRIQMLRDNIDDLDDYIVGGSMVSWGHEWLSAFDLAVFLYIPPDIRLERLKAREHGRYGDIIYIDPERHRQYLEFLAWAESYDDPASTRRSIGVHNKWMLGLTCKVIRIEGDISVEERVRLVSDVVQTQSC